MCSLILTFWRVIFDESKSKGKTQTCSRLKMMFDHASQRSTYEEGDLRTTMAHKR
jgi:hypothetical protein